MRASEFIAEGGWASTLTQGTHITPQLVANVMQIMAKQFAPALNKFLPTKGLDAIEIGTPAGSATYYQRDLQQQPDKEYGDVDVQFHIPRIDGLSNNANFDVYKQAVKEFCDSTKNFSSDNGVNVIVKSGTDYVQVDLVISYYQNKEWVRALAPEWNIKGVLCNSLYSAFGEAMNLSFGGGHGVQVKTVNGEIVPFRTTKGASLTTITNNPNTWAVDIAKYFGCKKFSQRIKAYPGLIDGEVRVSDIINSLRGIAETLEGNGKIPSAQDLLNKVKAVYLDKINKAINSSKYDKAQTPDAVAKAEHTKEMLATKSEEFARMFQ